MKCSISVYMITYYSVVQFTNLTIIMGKLHIAPCPDMAPFNLLWGLKAPFTQWVYFKAYQAL